MTLTAGAIRAEVQGLVATETARHHGRGRPRDAGRSGRMGEVSVSFGLYAATLS